MVGNIYKYNFNRDNIAIKYKDKAITYKDLDINISKYATYFSKAGVKKGNKVILNCINSPEFIYTYLAIVKLGGIIVPINPMSTLSEIDYIIKNSDAKTMVFHPNVLSQTNLDTDTLVNEHDINVEVLDENFNNTINSITEYNFEKINDKNLVSTFLYTSGTTGKPKAAMLSHKNLIANTDQFARTVNFYPEDNFMCVLPMFHVFAFTVCVLNPLYHGATITILEAFKPKEVIETLVKEGITVFAGVPSMYVVLLEAAKTDVSFPKLRLAISGGASLPVKVFESVKENLNLPIIEGYGLSEASPAVTFNPVDGIQKPGSIGLPIKDVECKVVDEKGNELEPGKVGELIVKGDNVMVGYYKQEAKNNETLKNDWLYTGDLAKKDEDSYFYIVDRKKDLIIVNGLNVYPREIEEIIYQHPKVKENAVIGIDNDLRGEYIKAYVVLKEETECSYKELFDYLKDHLSRYKLPREIEFINELPKNSTGKILKRKLKE